MLKKCAIFLISLFATIIFAITGLTQNMETLNESLMHKIIRGEKDEVTGLTYPIHFKWVLGIKDGGTILITLRGSEGKEFSICFDHRLETKTDGRIYIGTNHPNAGGELIEINSAYEKRLISLLREIIDSNLNLKQQKDLNKIKTWDDFDINMPLEDYKAAIVLIEIQHYKRVFHNKNS